MRANDLREAFVALALGTLSREGRLLRVTMLTDDRSAVGLADHWSVSGVLAN